MSDYVNKKDSIVNLIIAREIAKSNTLLQANANLLRNRVGQEYARMVLNTSNRALNSSLDKEVRRMLKGVKNNPITININGRNYDYAKYTKNAVRNTIKEIAQESALGRLQEMGGDFIIFSEHSDARELCEEDQGKIFSMSGGSGTLLDWDGSEIDYYDINDSSYGDVAGIMGANCRHQMNPYFPKEILS